MITELRRDVHLIRETEAVRFLRRELRDPSLITYWNLQTGTWVLAWWLYPHRGVAVEVEDLGDSFEAGPQLTRQLVHSLRWSWSPSAPTFKETRRRLVQNQRALYRKQLDRHEEHRDNYEYMKKQDKPVYFH